jgi:hypothetical protein
MSPGRNKGQGLGDAPCVEKAQSVFAPNAAGVLEA